MWHCQVAEEEHLQMRTGGSGEFDAHLRTEFQVSSTCVLVRWVQRVHTGMSLAIRFYIPIPFAPLFKAHLMD